MPVHLHWYTMCSDGAPPQRGEYPLQLCSLVVVCLFGGSRQRIHVANDEMWLVPCLFVVLHEIVSAMACVCVCVCVHVSRLRLNHMHKRYRVLLKRSLKVARSHDTHTYTHTHTHTHNTSCLSTSHRQQSHGIAVGTMYLASPRPESAWNVVTATESSPKASSRALSTTEIPHVTQLGDLTSGNGSLGPRAASVDKSTGALASGTTSGFVASVRLWGDIEKTMNPAACSESSMCPRRGAIADTTMCLSGDSASRSCHDV